MLRGATPNAACMMVMNFLYFMFSTAVGQSVAMTAGVGPSSQEMLPSSGAESKVLHRGDAAAARGQMTRSNNKTAVWPFVLKHYGYIIQTENPTTGG